MQNNTDLSHRYRIRLKSKCQLTDKIVKVQQLCMAVITDCDVYNFNQFYGFEHVLNLNVSYYIHKI